MIDNPEEFEETEEVMGEVLGDLLLGGASPYGQLTPYAGLTAAKAAALVSKQIA